MPAAPAARQDWALAKVIQPKARTGIFATHASRRSFKPAGDASFFSKMGAKTAKVAALAAAWVTFVAE